MDNISTFFLCQHYLRLYGQLEPFFCSFCLAHFEAMHLLCGYSGFCFRSGSGSGSKSRFGIMQSFTLTLRPPKGSVKLITKIVNLVSLGKFHNRSNVFPLACLVDSRLQVSLIFFPYISKLLPSRKTLW